MLYMNITLSTMQEQNREPMDETNVNAALCSNCTKAFNLKTRTNIYRCGDTYVCSKNCSQERFLKLRNIDPGLTRPHTWPLIKKTTSIQKQSYFEEMEKVDFYIYMRSEK